MDKKKECPEEKLEATKEECSETGLKKVQGSGVASLGIGSGVAPRRRDTLPSESTARRDVGPV